MIHVVVASSQGQRDEAEAPTPEGALRAACVLYREAGAAPGYRTATFLDEDGSILAAVDGAGLAQVATRNGIEF